MDEHELRIDGCVTIDISHDEWLDLFIGWLEENGWLFGGVTSEEIATEHEQE